jgi:hypothetical protein
MRILALCAVATFTVASIAQDVCAAPPLPAGKAASAAKARQGTAPSASAASASLAAAIAARRDSDPLLNGSVKDQLPPTSDLAKR